MAKAAEGREPATACGCPAMLKDIPKYVPPTGIPVAAEASVTSGIAFILSKSWW